MQFEIRYEAEKSVLINYFYQKIIWGHRCVVHSAVLWYDTTFVTQHLATNPVGAYMGMGGGQVSNPPQSPLPPLKHPQKPPTTPKTPLKHP